MKLVIKSTWSCDNSMTIGPHELAHSVLESSFQREDEYNKVFVIINPGTQKGGLGFGRRRKIIKSNKPQVHSCNQRRFLVLSV